MVKRKHKRAAIHHSETLAISGDRPQRLVVVSDTHGRPHPASAKHIAAQCPTAILHAGDIGSGDVIEGLRELAPTIAVRGNMDEPSATIPDSADITVVRDGRAIIKVLLRHSAVYGPKLSAEAARHAAAHHADLIVCGHSHVPFIGRDRGLLVFNPGSIGPRRFQLPTTFGVIDITVDKIDLRHINCETGDAWMP